MLIVMIERLIRHVPRALFAAGAVLMLQPALAQTEIEIGIGTQNTTTNTVTAASSLRSSAFWRSTCLEPAATRTSSTFSTGRTSPPARRSPTA